MPFRSKAILDEWITEFLGRGNHIPGSIDVLMQDGSDGSDTGLVFLILRDAQTEVYMQPAGPGQPEWEVTFERREMERTLTVEQVDALAAELALVADLCRFLEAKSVEYTRTHPAVLRQNA